MLVQGLGFRVQTPSTLKLHLRWFREVRRFVLERFPGLFGRVEGSGFGGFGVWGLGFEV